MGKKEKSKVAYLSAEVFSQTYESLFNSKNLSDVEIKFESGNSISAHRIILSNLSDILKKSFQNGEINDKNEYLVNKEEDEKTFTNMIKFLYTGKLEYTDEEDIIKFLIYGNNYKIKNIKEIKFPAKTVLNGIIQYIEKDIDSRKDEFDNLIENVDFGKVSKEYLMKLSKKSKWLKNNSTFLNQIVLKDNSDIDSSSKSDSESSKSEKSSDSDSSKSSESSDSKSSSDEDDDGPTKFNSKLSSTTFKFSKKNKIATFNSSGWTGTAIGVKKVEKYAIKLLSSNCNGCMVGFAPKNINKNGNNYNQVGYYFYLSNGYKYSQGNVCQIFIGGSHGQQGTVIGMKYNKKKGEIYLYKEKKQYGNNLEWNKKYVTLSLY